MWGSSGCSHPQFIERIVTHFLAKIAMRSAKLFFLMRNQKIADPPIPIPAMLPMTIPAMAPPESPPSGSSGSEVLT